MATRRLKIGTRGSPLALWQARWAEEALRQLVPNAEIELVRIRTLSENFPERPAAEIGVGIFTRELDDALRRGEVDLAVHSLKDIPSQLEPDLVIAAVPARESPFDAFLSRDGTPLEKLAAGARIGTGSPRRKAQLLHYRSDLEILPLRGNVATRIRKVRDLGLAGTVLACAGLKRLGEEAQITQILGEEILVPAVGQGALAVTACAQRDDIRALLVALDHPASHARITAERGFLRSLRGGCQVPAGALATFQGEETLRVLGVVASLDGAECLRGEVAGPVRDAEALGTRLAEELLGEGGARLLEGIGNRE
jgi:hydroxymethylbilane synthase